MITTLTTAALISISIEVMCIHLLIGLLFVFLNCFIAGFSGEDVKKTDFQDLLMWPFTLFAAIGLCTRVVSVKIASVKETKRKTEEELNKRKERQERHKSSGGKTKEE
ncbi:hypothetical protein [Vibrio phage phiKT1024]|nr:hypothetical protein [Vibrio phage phiKT1024]